MGEGGRGATSVLDCGSGAEVPGAWTGGTEDKVIVHNVTLVPIV